MLQGLRALWPDLMVVIEEPARAVHSTQDFLGAECLADERRFLIQMHVTEIT